MSPSEELSEPGIIGFLWRLHHASISIIKRTGWGQGELKMSRLNHGFVFPVTSPHPATYAELLY